MRSPLIRVVPALLACALLAAAARPPASGNGPASATSTSTCAGTIQSGGATSAFAWSDLSYGLTQPVGDTADVAGGTLDLNGTGYLYGGIQHQVVAWDPVAMAPDPTTVALRTVGYYVSAVGFTGPLVATYSPAIIRRQLASVAEAMAPGLALDWYGSVSGFHGSMATRYDSAGVTSVPAALWYSSTAARQPLPGPHPVLTHTVCAADSSFGALQVVQSVVRSDALTDPLDSDVLQVFRVPQQVQLHWVEFAQAAASGAGYVGPGILSIVDPAGLVVPPTYPPPPLVQGFLPFYGYGLPQWASHLDFDYTIQLQPAHDYWLLLHVNRNYRFYTRALTGRENANFISHIGPLWVRANSDSAWTRSAGQALDFRLIGEALGVAGVPVGELPAGRLQLRALANAARGAVAFAWSGARGALRFEVLDVRGRRVGTGGAAALAAGRWLWSATRPEGGPLSNGIYFVRATDAAGASATERVVLVR